MGSRVGEGDDAGLVAAASPFGDANRGAGVRCSKSELGRQNGWVSITVASGNVEADLAPGHCLRWRGDKQHLGRPRHGLQFRRMDQLLPDTVTGVHPDRETNGFRDRPLPRSSGVPYADL